MKNGFRFYKRFLTKPEKLSFSSLLVARSLLGILDVLGVLAIGYLGTSVANYVANGENVGKNLSFAGFELPALTATILPSFVIFIGGIFIIKTIASITLTKVMATKIAIVEARAAFEISSGVLGGGLERMKQTSRDELIYAVQVGTPAAFTGVLNSFASLFAEGFLFFIMCVSFITFSPITTLWMLIYFGILAAGIQLFVGRRLSIASSRAMEKIIEANRSLGDLISAFRELAVSGQRGMFFRRIYFARMGASTSIGEQVYLAGMPRYVIETGLIIGLGAFILFQSQQADLVTSASTIGVFLAGGFRIVAAMLPWQNALVNIKNYSPQAKTVWAFLESVEKNELPALSVSFQKEHEPASVELRNVTYFYEDDSNPAISDISVSILPGQHVAFIGQSGAGKSTIADLILGLVNPKIGEVLINGLPAEAVRTNNPGIAGYVPQAPGMVAGTILENIAIGVDKRLISQERLDLSIREAHLETLLGNLPEGVNTDLGLYQDSLSGGQRQRIGLARALYTRPGLVVLDEATSALDAQSENEVVETFKSLRGKVTLVTIAHRLNTIQNADVVFLVDDGKIVAAGTLDDLNKSNEQVARAIQLLTVNFGSE